MTRALFADEGWRPAGAFWRSIATLLDMALYCGLCMLIAVPVGQAFDWSTLWGGIDEIANAASNPNWLGHASSIVGLWIALWWCYFLVGWGLLGWTPGKLVLGLRVVDHQGRCPIGASRAAMRLVAYTASSATLVCGHLLALFRCDCRALHDVLSGTRVVRWKRDLLRARES